MKKWIDNAPYEALLSHWKHAAPGDPYMEGEVGAHFKEALRKKRNGTSDNGHTRSTARNLRYA